MTFDDDLMSVDRECGADAAAYALGALEPREAEAFRRHMAVCAVCHDEVAAFGQVADALPMSAPQLRPPPGLRKRVIRAVRADATENIRQPARRSRRGLRFRFAMPRAAAAIGVAVAAAVAVIGGVELSSGGSGSRVIQARVIGIPGTAQLRLSGGHAELIVRHLAPPPAGRIYEVWLQRRGALSPTRALFSVTANGAGDVGVPGALRGVSAVLVTQEPDGGSLVPTHAPVIVARLT
jgi:anti-sigma-K factor RskA